MDKSKTIRNIAKVCIVIILLILTILSATAVKVTLVSNTPQCFSCETIYHICQDTVMQAGDGAFDVDFYDTKIKPQSVLYQLSTVEKTIISESVPVYKTVYDTISKYDPVNATNKTTVINRQVIDHYDTVEKTITQINPVSKSAITATLGAGALNSCYDVSIKGNLKPGQSLDNVLTIGTQSFGQFAWWNNNYTHKIDLNCSGISATTPIIINGSNGFNIGAGSNWVWTTCASPNNLSLYWMASNLSNYVVIANDSVTWPYEIELGNNTGYLATSVWDNNFTLIWHGGLNALTNLPIDSTKYNFTRRVNNTASLRQVYGPMGLSWENVNIGCFYSADNTAWKFPSTQFQYEIWWMTNNTVGNGYGYLFGAQGTAGLMCSFINDPNNGLDCWMYTGSWNKMGQGYGYPPSNSWIRYALAVDSARNGWIWQNASTPGASAVGATISGYGNNLGIACDPGLSSYPKGFTDEARISNINRSQSYFTNTWNNYNSVAGYGMLSGDITTNSYNPPPTWTQYPPNITGNKTIPVTIKLNASDPGDNLTWYINNTGMLINNTGWLSWLNPQAGITFAMVQVNDTGNNTLLGYFSFNMSCTPLWYCFGFGACQVANMTPCLVVSDNNSCGAAYNGSLSAYDIACVYIPPSANTNPFDVKSGSIISISVLFGLIILWLGCAFLDLYSGGNIEFGAAFMFIGLFLGIDLWSIHWALGALILIISIMAMALRYISRG